jgi:uncharacterized membrane protein
MMTEREAEVVQKRTHRIIAAVLRIGLGLSVLLATLAMALGHSRLLTGSKPSLKLDSRFNVALASATLSLAVLAATPALRVLLLGSLWARQRDWRFALVALAVAGVLAASTLLGHGE